MALANYSSRHWLMTISGNIFGAQLTGAQEHWSMGLRLVGASAQVAPTQADVNALTAPTSTWISTGTMSISNQHKLTGIKLAPIGQNGLYPPGEVSVQTAALNYPGVGSSAPSWPAQCSMAISLTTGVPRGRAHIGRIYMPPCQAVGLDADGSLLDATVTAMLGTTRTWINAINGVFPDAKVFVMSRFGDQHQVTGLRIGQIPDTQRRRRRSLAETPLSLAL